LALPNSFRSLFFVALAAITLTPWCSPPLALLLGIAFAIALGNPYPTQSKTWSRYLLQIAIVGLGFGLDFGKVIEAGRDGLLFTIISIFSTLVLGWLLSRWLTVPRVTSILISCGTAICGGSAIAAIAPVIEAKHEEISVALGCVFLLNALALFVFPPLGHMLGLTQAEFGLWAAIAIHDTSSVVGAAQAYGAEALEIATVIKLSRALWIVPLVLVFIAIERRRNMNADAPAPAIPIPWFIGLFLLASILRTVLQLPGEITEPIVMVAKRLFSLTLFLIGAGLSLASIRAVGPRSLALGVLLWLFISSLTLAAVMFT
jgi:uncharacterized integral membrane protein (TIGR00698 family)